MRPHSLEHITYYAIIVNTITQVIWFYITVILERRWKKESK